MLAGRATEPNKPNKEDQAIIDKYETPLTEDEKSEAEELFSQLPIPAVNQVGRLGADDRNARLQGSAPGFFESLIRHKDALETAGVITDVARPAGYDNKYTDEKFYVLTPKGRLLARYLLS